MSLQYIIDGYNIINHPTFVKLAAKRTSDRRRALLDLISHKHLTGSRKNEVICVFDGFPESGLTYGAQAVFSGKKSADDVIRGIAERSPNPRVIIVISDDRQVQFFAKSCGAKIMSVADFLQPAESQAQALRHASTSESELPYTEKEKINRELRKLWLKE